MSVTVSTDELGKAIARELEVYHEDIIVKVKQQAKEHMARLVKQTKATAPVGHRKKHYRDNITSKKVSEDARGVKYVWCVNGSDYRLSHLLERGHAKRNGGRVEGTHFIEKASTPILEQYEEAVKGVIENG